MLTGWVREEKQYMDGISRLMRKEYLLLDGKPLQLMVTILKRLLTLMNML